MTDIDREQLAALSKAIDRLTKPKKELEKDLPEVKELENANPETRGEILLEVGDWGRRTQSAWMRRLSEGVETNQTGLNAKIEQMRKELGGPAPSPLEQMLVERIICCWLQVNEADRSFRTREGGGTLAQGEYWQRRLDRAHRRFLQSIKALAQIRKLLGPNVQVNVAEKQINIMDVGATRKEGSESTSHPDDVEKKVREQIRAINPENE